MAVKCLYFNLLILSSIFIIYANGDDEPQCLYQIVVKTGTIEKAGTNAKISLTLADSSRDTFIIPNLEDWGTMGLGRDYFEKGNFDSFAGVGRCLNGQLCEIKLTSNGTGDDPSWYCEYVVVSSFGSSKPPSQNIFSVYRWLAVDKPPYQLYAAVDMCPLIGEKKPTKVWQFR